MDGENEMMKDVTGVAARNGQLASSLVLRLGAFPGGAESRSVTMALRTHDHNSTLALTIDFGGGGGGGHAQLEFRQRGAVILAESRIPLSTALEGVARADHLAAVPVHVLCEVASREQAWEVLSDLLAQTVKRGSCKSVVKLDGGRRSLSAPLPEWKHLLPLLRRFIIDDAAPLALSQMRPDTAASRGTL
jgi:hypothetical protein